MSSSSAPTQSTPAPNGHSSLCRLLAWKDPVKTGTTFGAVVAALTIVKLVNLVTLFFRAAYWLLLVLAATEFASKVVLKRGLISSYKPARCSYAACFNKNVLPLLADFNVRIESQVQKVINVADIELTLKAAGICFLVYVLTSAFSFYFLLVTFVILAFTGPVTYTTFKTEIDATVSKYSACVKSETCNVLKQAKTKTKPYVDCAAKMAAPITKHLEALLSNTARTAGSNVSSTGKTFGTGADKSIPKNDAKAAELQASTAAKADKISTHTPAAAAPVASGSHALESAVPEPVEPIAYTTGAMKASENADTEHAPTLQVIEDIKAATEAGPLH